MNASSSHLISRSVTASACARTIDPKLEIEERDMSRPSPVPASATPLVELHGVTKEYPRGSETVHVLQELSLSIPRGDFLALMGPSGSGKTTLLNLLGGIDRPTSGTIS